jgi:hypothetical protein
MGRERVSVSDYCFFFFSSLGWKGKKGEEKVCPS